MMMQSEVLRSVRTRLVQRQCLLSSAIKEFSNTGHSGHEVCLIIVVNSASGMPCCPCSILTAVPSGPWIFRHEFGAYRGEMSPGAHWCLPAWKGVSHLVTKQVVTFNAKPKKCPTRDSVFVDVDMSVNFRIGPDLDRVRTFVFRMGAEKLDAYLNLTLEEGIRTLVYGVTHDKVNDLRSEFAISMLATLQSKATRFGVEILNVKITDVQLPRELQDRLEKTTAFRTRLLEEAKNHEHALQQLSNASEQTYAQIRQEYSIECARIVAHTDRLELEMDKKLAAAKSDRAVQVEKAHSDKQVAVVDARGDVAIAEYEGRMKKQDEVETARIDSEALVRAAEVEAANARTQARAQKDASSLLADARLAEAKADGIVADRSQQKRLFEDRLRLSAIDADLALTGRRVLSGKDGANILSSLVAVRAELIDRR